MKLPTPPKFVMDKVPSWVPEPMVLPAVYLVLFVTGVFVSRLMFALFAAAFAALISLAILAFVVYAMYSLYEHWIYDSNNRDSTTPPDTKK